MRGVTKAARLDPRARWRVIGALALLAWLWAGPLSAQPVIAILDSGVDAGHPGLAGRIVSGYDLVDGDSIPEDPLGHGTAIAGIIAASGEAAGVCSTCRIMPIRVAESEGGGQVDPVRLAAAIRLAVYRGARVIYVGSGSVALDPMVADAIAVAELRNVVVIAPAGGSGWLNSLYPAAIPTVISVAAFENGPGPDAMVVARGSEVCTLAPGGGTTTRSGSSMAAARVAGAAGRVLQRNPDLTAEQMRQVLRFGVVPHVAPEGMSDFEHGVHDLGQALARASAGYADLALTRIWLLPGLPLPGQSPRLKMRVVNQGNVITPPTRVDVNWKGERSLTTAVPELRLGQQVELGLTLPASLGSDDFRVVAELLAVPGETDLADNVASIVVRAAPRPRHDIALEVGALVGPAPEAGPIRLPIRVRNLGNQAERGVRVELSVDDSVISSRRLDLAVGAEAALSESWAIPPAHGATSRGILVRARSAAGDDNPADNTWGGQIGIGRPGGRGRLQYADRPGTDVVIDAPWRTVRDYVPVLFFFPQFEGGRRVESIRVSRCVNGVPTGSPIVLDRRVGADSLRGATFIGPLGEARGGIGQSDRIRNFWHYVMRVPIAALGVESGPAVLDLYAEVLWTRQVLMWRETISSSRVLRVQVDARQFPVFDPQDRYFDTHNHTIAEQSTAGFFGADSPHKAYAAPIVMLVESAYALGMVQTPPRDGNWSAFRDSLAITDHNIFYSTEPYDTGSRPAFGPTSTAADGHAAEAAWYRANLGRLSGEEITLRRGSNQDSSAALNIGHHLLAYDTRHFEGPWHGGLFLTSRVENPNTVESVLAGMKAAGPTGFAFSSHPELASFVWPPEYFAQAIGLPPYDSKDGPHVNASGTAFLYKGSEVWNTKLDQVAAGSGRLPSSSEFDAINPFPGGREAQRFGARPWDGELTQSLDTLFTQIGRGLSYSFRENPSERFIRKLYMIAGSDAHGDFNYTDEVSATAVPYSGGLNANAFARVRTCALVHDRPADSRDALDALREGNAVLTDGPIAMFQLDADGRHDPGAGAARWHDAAARFENADGLIGGQGDFDGGRTMLVPLPGEDAWIRSRWLKSTTPGAGDISRYRFDRVMEAARDSFVMAAGSEGATQERALPRAMDRMAALIATARDLKVDERCITNPVWMAPVRIEVGTPALEPGTPPAAALAARSFRVSFHFPISMTADGPARAFLRPLDDRGVSTDPEIELMPDPGWEAEDGVAAARFSVTNAERVPMPDGDWDTETHSSVPGRRSFVVYLVGPSDVHGNRLNDVGRAITVVVAK